jgi:hypothetical protein
MVFISATVTTVWADTAPDVMIARIRTSAVVTDFLMVSPFVG